MSEIETPHQSGAVPGDLSQSEQRMAGQYARSPEGRAAGANVAMGMLAELAVRGQTPATQEAARALMAEGGAEVIPGAAVPATGAAGGIPAAIPLASPAEPVPAIAPAPEPPSPFPAEPFPGSPAPFLTAPTPPWDDDDDEEDARQSAAEAAAEVEDDEGWVDPDQLRAQLAKERKRREHAEKQAAKAKVGAWIEEAVKTYGQYISDEELAGIEATSRRAFLREADRIARQNHAVLQRFGVQPQAPAAAAPAAQPQETHEQMVARIRAEERARAEAAARDAWGRPMQSPAAPAPLSDAEQAKSKAVDRARKTGNLEGILRANLFGR